LIQSISPSCDATAGGTPIYIDGIGFLGVDNVYFDTKPAISFTINSDTSITAISPSYHPGKYTITVDTTSNGTSTIDPSNVSANQFIYYPYITGVSPNTTSMYAETERVTIRGIGLTNNVKNVYFGTTNALSFEVDVANHCIVAYSPPCLLKHRTPNDFTVDIVVVTGDGQTSLVNEDQFTYQNIPYITSVVPNIVTIHEPQPIQIHGYGFSTVTDISFGYVILSSPNFTIQNDTLITVTTPIFDQSGGIGIRLKSSNGSFSNTSPFTVAQDTYYTNLPIIYSIDPSSGTMLGGTEITIHGSNFMVGHTSVLFNSIQLTGVVDILNTTTIKCTTPQGVVNIMGNQSTVNIKTPYGTSVNSPNSIFYYTYGNMSNPHFDLSYTEVFAILGQGGFFIEEEFPMIKLAQQLPVTSYDVTNAVQVLYDVNLINTKLGILKDSSNSTVLDSSYNPATDSLPIDSITITADEFRTHMTTNQVISVGTYSTLYSDFFRYVNTYFSYPDGFPSLFVNADDVSYNQNVFDASAFIHIINEYGPDTITHETIHNLSGSITINNINSVLRYAVDSNIFNNRPPSNRHYGIADGFIAGDLIMVPAGTTVTLKLEIQPELSLPINNFGPYNVQNLCAPNTPSTPETSIDSQYNYSNKYNSTMYTKSTVATTTNITSVLTAPLLLILDNFSGSIPLHNP